MREFHWNEVPPKCNAAKCLEPAEFDSEKTLFGKKIGYCKKHQWIWLEFVSIQNLGRKVSKQTKKTKK